MAQKYNEKPHKIKAVKGTTDICPSKAKRMVKINGLEELDYGNSLRKDSRFDALKSNKQPQKKWNELVPNQRKFNRFGTNSTNTKQSI